MRVVVARVCDYVSFFLFFQGLPRFVRTDAKQFLLVDRFSPGAPTRLLLREAPARRVEVRPSEAGMGSTRVGRDRRRLATTVRQDEAVAPFFRESPPAGRSYEKTREEKTEVVDARSTTYMF